MLLFPRQNKEERFAEGYGYEEGTSLYSKQRNDYIVGIAKEQLECHLETKCLRMLHS